MRNFALWCALAIVCSGSAADVKLDPLLKSVEDRYNRAQSLRLDFVETYAARGHARQTESGVLYLRKPGRMRWEYASPAGKLFVSDGKSVYLYLPDSNRVEKTRLKESDDMHAPLAFLLGKLNFWKEFKKFETRSEGIGTWVAAWPNSENLSFTKIEFFIAPSAEIKRVRVYGQDESVLDYGFEREKVNPPLSAGLFAFRTPAGAEIVEGAQ